MEYFLRQMGEQQHEQGCSRCYGLAVAPEAAASAVAHYLGNGSVVGRDERPRSSAVGLGGLLVHGVIEDG